MRDYDAPNRDAHVYRHPNDPDHALKVFDCMTDTTITSVVRAANKIAETGWSGPRMPLAVKERARITRQKEKTSAQRAEDARKKRADAAEAEFQRRKQLADDERRRREIEKLMEQGYGK